MAIRDNPLAAIAAVGAAAVTLQPSEHTLEKKAAELAPEMIAATGMSLENGEPGSFAARLKERTGLSYDAQGNTLTTPARGGPSR